MEIPAQCLFDGLGSVRQVADAATGNVVKGYDYDAWGSVAAQSGTLANPYQYLGSLGYYTDPDSGLLHVGYRQYSPAVGRWMTEDPIGLAGGANLYRYSGDDPVGRADPSGLAYSFEQCKALEAKMARQLQKIAEREADYAKNEGNLVDNPLPGTPNYLNRRWHLEEIARNLAEKTGSIDWIEGIWIAFAEW